MKVRIEQMLYRSTVVELPDDATEEQIDAAIVAVDWSGLELKWTGTIATNDETGDELADIG